MKSMRILCFLIMLLINSGLPSPVKAAQLSVSSSIEQEPLRPEDYLVSDANLPQALTNKYPFENFRSNREYISKLPNLYIAEKNLIGDDTIRIRTRIMVGVPGYWDGYNLTGKYVYSSIEVIEDLGDYAILVKNGSDYGIYMIKGNCVIEISVEGGGDRSDVQLLAGEIVGRMPDELPHPDTWQIEVPAPAENISFPSKYIYSVYKSGEQGIFYNSSPDSDHMRLITRYPFNKFTMALWSIELQSYIYIEDMRISMYDMLTLAGEHSARVATFTFGKYEIHYWVNGEFAGSYPFRIVEDDENEN